MKKINLYTILCLILLPISLSSFAQTWPKFYGHRNISDHLSDVIETYDKGYLICGTYYPNYNYNEKWGWLIKTNINGEVLWDRLLSLGYMGYVTPLSIEQSRDGGILVCGATVRNENYAGFVMKLNACGENEWCKSFVKQNEIHMPFSVAIKEIDNGEIVVLAQNLEQTQYETIHLIKLNANGEILWIKPFVNIHDYPESAENNPTNLIITSDNKYLISGYGYWKHPWEPDGVYWLRPFFALSDSDGNEEWVLPYGINDTIIGEARQGMIEDLDGNFWCPGYKYSLTETGMYGILMKFNAEGNELGYIKFDYKNINEQYNAGWFHNMASVDSMIVIMSIFGNTSWSLLDLIKAELLFDGFEINKDLNLIDYYVVQQLAPFNLRIIKPLTSGKYLRSFTYKKSNIDYDIYLARCNLNLEYDTAYTGNFTYDSLCATGPQQSGFIYLNDCDIVLGTENLSESKPNDQNLIITIYPSPAKDHLNFTFKYTQQYQNLELKCFNMLGLQQSETISLKGRHQISKNIMNWQPGIYIAVLFSEGKPVGKEKFIVY
ncbi:MAG: T9SS type A sorting domain-containing protein [Bacteroidales bacterium]